MKAFQSAACASLLILACVGNTNAFAGWISGGGKIKRDADNPWFIFNTEKVTWCAELDESNFSNNLNQGMLLIEKGLAYWKRELSNAKGVLNPEYPFQKLGTQDFIYKQCDGSEDLKFLLGKVTPGLTEYLAKQDEAPHDYVGLAVRTSYDIVNLKAKGFIYISPDMAGSPHLPRNARFKQNVWSLENGAFLQAVINHELGHIFGIQHNEPSSVSGIDYVNLMTEEFPEIASVGATQVINASFPRIFNWEDFDPSTDETAKTCDIDPKFRLFFQIQSSIDCIEMVRIDDTVEIKEISRIGEKKLIASMLLYSSSGRGHSPFNLWLPHGQRVVKDDNNVFIEGRGVGVTPFFQSHEGYYVLGLLNSPEVRYHASVKSESGCAEISVVTSLSDAKRVRQVFEKVQHPEAGARACDIY
jgi:hypothetical protein